MEPYRAEPSRLPWWVICTGHGLLTGAALTGLVTTGGPGRWAWLLVTVVAVAAAKVSRTDHAAAVAIELDRQRAEVSSPDRSAGW